MTSILPLANRLKALPGEELAKLLGELIGNSATCSDLFDLAKLMLSRRELEERIRRLSKAELQNLASNKNSATLKASWLSDGKVFPEAIEVFQQLKPVPLVRLSQAASSLSAYETLVAITEILFSLEQHWFEKTRTGLKASDAKLIAEKLKWPTAELQTRFKLAIKAGLIGEHAGRWVASERAEQWLEKSRADAYAHLATSCWDLPKLKLLPTRITDQLSAEYPLLDQSKLALLQFGASLGLLDRDEPRPAMLAGNLSSVIKAVTGELPKTQDKLVIQGDLTIVCPGPIDSSLQRELDSFADSEDLGLACRFRLSALSVSHHLESGGSVAEIQKTLERASNGKLPQPVGYLLEETANRFGSLKVLSNAQTEITSDDEILLTQILNERLLAHLGLKKVDGRLLSSASQEICYFSLRESGYAAVMVDAEGGISSPRFSAPATEVTDNSELLARAVSLLSGEKASADQGDVSRQLEFALKNKLQVSLTLEVEGQVSQMLLTPLGLANNRLRGRDEAKQAERTLPLSKIRSVVLS